MKKEPVFLLLWLILPTPLDAHGAGRVPTIDQLIQLKTLNSAVLSPDGNWLAYRVNGADFQKDVYRGQLWLVEVETGQPFQLTRGEDSVSGAQWSPDGNWLAFTRPHQKKDQIFAIRPGGGEAIRLSQAAQGVSGFAWSGDGKKIAFSSDDPEPEALKNRNRQLGDYLVVRKGYRYRHLWMLEVDKALKKPQEGDQLTEGQAFSVLDLAWSPNGRQIVFSASVNPDLINRHTADLYLLEVTSKEVKPVVQQPGPDRNPRWSPDGTRIVFSTYMGASRYYARNSRLAVVPASGGTPRSLTDAFDERPRLIEWSDHGLYFSALQKMASHLFRLDPDTGKITRLSQPAELMGSDFSFSSDGNRVAFRADSPSSLHEIFLTGHDFSSPRRLTRMTDQVESWELGVRETIRWKSRDGTEIEGVLIKPQDFDPSQRHPLVCVIHGGPTGIDRPALLSRGTRYYPVDLWAGRGVVVLRVNYRGSAGYGEKFRTLNIRNLGVGDAWDVIAGVDSLVDKGWVDPQKVGCMGWSQGGYISAFLTTSSDRFAAISVGAGISNWSTYYYNTDITPFTINYLGHNPVGDPEIYRKTSPMSYIEQAQTPTLIQHGEFDRRVPIPNAYELRQGLEDRGVPVEMIVYKGFGHGISKPRSMRAVMRHNLEWFSHYLLGDRAPDFVGPDLPAQQDDKEEEKSPGQD